MVLFGNPAGHLMLIIELPPLEVLLADALRWEHMDAFTPEDIHEANEAYCKAEAEKAALERRFKEQREESREKMYRYEEELFASVGLRPDGRPTLASTLEQARCFGYARGLRDISGEPLSPEDREEDERLHNHWRYGIYGKEGFKARQRELMERGTRKFMIELQPLGPKTGEE